MCTWENALAYLIPKPQLSANPAPACDGQSVLLSDANGLARGSVLCSPPDGAITRPRIGTVRLGHMPFTTGM